LIDGFSHVRFGPKVDIACEHQGTEGPLDSFDVVVRHGVIPRQRWPSGNLDRRGTGDIHRAASIRRCPIGLLRSHRHVDKSADLLGVSNFAQSSIGMGLY
jgi:hypothetical protein